MNVQQDKLHIFALRMRWLSWLARPVVGLWHAVVRGAAWFWSLCVLSWRSLVQSFSYKYWFLAVLGGAVAFFFILYFYFLGNRIKEPNLVWIGAILATLPIGWSMAEISSLIRRKAVTGEDFSISEIRYQLGSGFKAVRMLLKYVFWAVLFVAIQIGFGFLVHVPAIGPALFTLTMVPVLILAVFAFFCIILILFGLAVFPVHVLYSQPQHDRGFLSRQFAEAAFILSFLKKNFFRFIFGSIPVSILSVPLLVIPGLLFGGAIGLSVFLTTQAMSLGSVFAEIPAKLSSVFSMLQMGNWDVWGALSAIFVSVSIAIFAGMFFSLVVAFLASFFFNVYTRGIYFATEEQDEEETQPESVSHEKMMLPLPEDLIEDEKFKIDDLDGDTGFLKMDEESGFSSGTAALGAGIGLAAGAGLALGSGGSGSEPADSRQNSLSESGFDEDTGFDDVSGADILASIESTMPISDQIPAGDVPETETADDETFSLNDMDNPDAFGEVSGADILASIESTMPIAEEPAPSAEQDESETLSVEDLTVDSSMGEDVSGADILASIESTMPIAEDTVPDFNTQLEAENEQLASFDVDSALEDEQEPVNVPEESLSTDEEISNLSNELDILLDSAEEPEAATLQNGIQDGTTSADDALEIDLDSLPEPAAPEAGAMSAGAEAMGSLDDDFDALLGEEPAPAAPEQAVPAGGDDLDGLDGDLDALLGGEPAEAMPAAPDQAAPAGGDDLDALLGEEPAAAPAGGDDLDALLGETEPAVSAPLEAPAAPEQAVPAGGDDLDGLDGDLDALLGGEPAEAMPAAPEQAAPTGGDNLDGLDGDLDALLGGEPAEAMPVAPDQAAPAGGDDLDALLGEEPSAATAAAGGDDLDGLDGDLDALLGEEPAAAPAGGDDLDALLGETEPAVSAPLEAPAAPEQAAPTGRDNLDGLDGDLDALLGGEPAEAMPVASDQAAPAGGDDLDALLGEEPSAATAAAGGDDLDGLDGDLDALLGETEPAASAPVEAPAAPEQAAPAGGDDLDALLGDEPVAAAAPAIGDDLDGLDGDLDALLGETEPAVSAPIEDPAAPVPESSTADDDFNALLGEEPASAAAPGGGDDLDALLGGEPAAAAPAAGGDDLDALLGGEPSQTAPASAETPVTPATVTPFSDKGIAGAYSYLVSVKEENRVYFGIKGAALAEPQRFQLTIGYSGGGNSTEEVIIQGLDDKGMGYTQLDLSAKLADPAFGAVTSISVAQ